ncbi:MAG: TauD/TfdA dioxygenase family protein [Lautropia sp.]
MQQTGEPVPERPAVLERAGLQVVRQGGNLGAEIRGADLGRPLSDEQFAAIHDALVANEVVFFRDQDITLDQQREFAARFGEPSIHPFSPNLDDKRDVIVLDYTADNPPALTDQWHADETFRRAPPLATVLRARVLPAYGGDTVFSSMTAAYTGLSEPMKRYIHGMEALHDFKPWRGLFTSSEKHQKKLAELEREFPMTWHPVVRVHPVSGRRILNVNPQFCIKLKGLRTDESDHMLQFLYSRAAIPEYQFRLRWAVDTVVVWDNRSVQHYAPHDYWPQRRTMERVTISGDPVRGVEGPYTPEQGVAPLPDGHHLDPALRRPTATREFERA